MSAEAQDLIFEIGTEELPPKNLQNLAANLASLFVQGLKDHGLQFESYTHYASPRRIAVLVKNLVTQQGDQHIERRGPALKAAYDKEGKPSKALQGFSRSCGVTPDQLSTVETEKGSWMVFSKTDAGKETKTLLPTIAEKAIQQLPIAKRMNWGANKIGFVRPVHWILFLHGDQVVPCKLLGKQAGNITRGHRFHHPEAITITSPSDYAAQLETIGGVIAEFEKRKAQVKEQALKTANQNQHVIIDENLLNEVTGLVEQPHTLLGKFEESFLEVPQEALISAMQEHQKYFPVVDHQGKLQPYFVITANIQSKRPKSVIEGNEKVIRPRLADAKFFYETDRKETLEEKNNRLKNIVFQNKLGTIYNKVERSSQLAASIAEKIGGDVAQSRRAALLSKADLATEMVGEFPDLQGVMGYYYALKSGETEETALAIKEHYQPKFAGDKLPTSKIGLSVSLADKLDTLIGIFGIGQIPSGDKDPFALRRAALGIIRIIIERSLTLDLEEIINESVSLYGDKLSNKNTKTEALDFILGRFRAYYKDQNISTEIIQSVERLKPTRPLDFDQRIKAVEKFVTLPEAKALSAANKRVQNILKKQDKTFTGEVLNADLLLETAEKQLAEKVLEKERLLSPLFKSGDYSTALLQLADLRENVDSFFDNVMVNTEDEALRNNRLLLLSKLSNLFLEVADISVLPN
ncbi:MAG: glycine--tRNA ligase subunit beta [Pseudomonadales bacterium]|nr:glycine--tRNA ligase subunit beta [Pseudomonadales bacterium]